MKILYIHQHFSTPSGFTGTRSYEMARALVLAGHSVHMLCGSSSVADTGLKSPFVRGKRYGIVDGIRVTEFNMPYSNNYSIAKRSVIFVLFALRSALFALTEPGDLVFSTSTPLTVGIPGICAKWLRKRKFIFEVRDLWPDVPEAMGVIKNPVILIILSALESLSYRSADACIGLSPGIVTGIKKKCLPETPVQLIPNGCDFSLFSESSHSAIRPEGVLERDFEAIFTGAHGIANGLDSVLDTAEILKTCGRGDVKLVFIGEGSERNRLMRRVNAEGLEACIFMDKVQKSDLASYLRGADIGLMVFANIPAFYYCTSPNKFFDYLAMGMPVLCNYPGWLASIIDENELGVVVPPNSPKSFAAALCRLADNRESLFKMKSNASLLARNRFDRTKLAKQFVSFLELHGDNSVNDK